MSEPDAKTGSSRGRFLGCGCLAWLGITFVVIFLLSLGIGTGWIETLFTLLFGWVAFLNRTGERIHWNFDLIGMGLLCTVIGLVVAHWLFKGLVRAAGEARGKSWRWPVKWTCCGAGILGLVFLVGMAVGGIVHQIGWIHSNPEPLMEQKGRNWAVTSDMRMLALAFRMASSDNETNNLAAIRQDMWNPAYGYLGTPQRALEIMQGYHFLLILDQHQTAQGYLIFPRNPALAQKMGGCFCFEGKEDDWLNWEKIQALLQEYRDRLQPL